VQSKRGRALEGDDEEATRGRAVRAGKDEHRARKDTGEWRGSWLRTETFQLTGYWE